MYIDKITINNFRIYYGVNTISIAPNSRGNVCVIGGDNGYGKTTLLTSLVWCLYGNQIQDIDNTYRKRINSAGGYNKYLLATLNRKAALLGESIFSVGIELKDLELPGIQCESMQITREYDATKHKERLSVFIDNKASELVDDLGQQIFINDFILPKEIAKFFFFDAEIIVEIAEVQSLQEKRDLSQAYSEVLGLKKYEELKNMLNDMRLRFRKDSVTGSEKKQFEELHKEIERITRKINDYETQKQSKIEERNALRIKSDTFHEKLLREGNTLSIDEIITLQQSKRELLEENKALNNGFKDLFEYAPFAICSHKLLLIRDQLDVEEKIKKSLLNNGVLKSKIDFIINSLRNDKSIISIQLPDDVKQNYIDRVQNIIENTLLDPENDSVKEEANFIHDFSIDDINKFSAMLQNLSSTYREKLKTQVGALKLNKIKLADTSKKLADIEAIESDELIRSYRQDKINIDKSIINKEEEALDISKKIGALENDLIYMRKQFDSISNKIQVNSKYQDKDQLATRLVKKLDDFIIRMKLEKKLSLESRILANMNGLMHKQEFISKVEVDVDSEILEIRLFSKSGIEINKDDLSKGEQQLYATSILKSLVEESGIDFPVFIDSPLQKFDHKHSRNIITSFYPYISKQVIILPLLNKELGKEEFELLFEHINSIHLIENNGGDSSKFVQIEKGELTSIEKEIMGVTV